MNKKEVIEKALIFFKANLDDAIEAFSNDDIVCSITESDIDDVLKDINTIKYVIFGGIDEFNNDPMYWSNKDGWGEFEDATIFNKEEHEEFKYLPKYTDMDSKWIRVNTIIILNETK